MDNNIGNGRRTKDVLLVVSTILLMLGLIFVTLKPDLFSSKNALFTGLVVSEQSGALDINSTYSIDSVVPLNITEDITSLRLSGTILGTGNVTILLKTDTKQYVIFDTTRSTSNTNSENNGITGLIISDITGNEQTVDTDTDNVTDNNTLVNISEDTQHTDINTTSENISQYTTEDTTQNISGNETENAGMENVSVRLLDNECLDTCSLPEIVGPYTLSINIDGNATLNVTSITYTFNSKQKVLQTAQIPNIVINRSFALNLSQYFSGDELIFDSSSLKYGGYVVIGDTLSYTYTYLDDSASPNNTESAFIYVIQGGRMTQSNTFNITWLSLNYSGIIINATTFNMTANTTTNATLNTTLNMTVNNTLNTTINTTLNATINMTMNVTSNITVSEDNFTTAMMKNKFKKLDISNILKFLRDNVSEEDINLSDRKKPRDRISLHGLKNMSELRDVEFISNDNISNRRIHTDVAFVNSINMTNATIRLSKTGAVSNVARCDDYDPVTYLCNNWIPTDIPFTDYDDYIEFTVDHFTGYGGISGNGRYYVKSSASYNNTAAMVNLSAVQTGGAGKYINRTNATITGANILLNMLNASITNLTGLDIKTTNLVNFSVYWQTGQNVSGNATYKLYDNSSGTLTLICQYGNDSTGGIGIPNSTNGLKSAGCTPTINNTMNTGDGLVFVVDLWVTAATGNISNRWATIRYDNSTYNTSVAFTYITDTLINVSVNQTYYVQGQSINASGAFYWVNGTNISSKNVNVSFINTTGGVVYTTNATTNPFGLYSANYTISSSADTGTWTINVTGFYNVSINATNSTTFSVLSGLPVITSFPAISAQNPTESTTRLVQFNFTVNDNSGNSTLNMSSASARVNLSGVTRQSTACSGVAINLTAQNITCNVSMQYYDLAGVWSINISLRDNGGNYAQNTTTTFTYNSLQAIVLNSNLFAFGSLNSGDENKTTTPLTINNTGNYNFTHVQIKAYNLANGSYFINASQFTINVTNVSVGNVMSNNTLVNITGALLPPNTDSVFNNETLYIYVDVPTGTAAKVYRSLSDWVATLG